MMSDTALEPVDVSRVLVVDDDEVDFRQARRLLHEAFGSELELDWVQGVDSARDLVKSEQHDVYIIDYHLGGETGLELMGELNCPHRSRVVIFLSGIESAQVDKAITRAGASDYLIKSEVTAALLERSIRYGLAMEQRKSALHSEAAELRAAKARIEEQTEEYIAIAEDLAATQNRLQQAFARLEESESRYRFLAEHDNLTHLPNRAVFTRFMEDELGKTAATGLGVALFLLDLDRFKAINDSLGHPAGDALLVDASRRLVSALRECDLAARLGGDEFGVAVTNLASRSDALAIADKVIEAFSEPSQILDWKITTSVSLGIAFGDSAESSFETLFRNADTALYEVKRLGRGTYRVFDEKLDERLRRNEELRTGLSSALDNKELFLEFQPQVSATDGRVSALEALIRWRHPKYGVLTANEFIPYLEKSFTENIVTEWVIEQACIQARSLRDDIGFDAPIAVNVSPAELRNPGFARLVQDKLDRVGLRPEFLEIEITESSLLDNITAVQRNIEALSILGIRIALDDFGTGFSSFAHIRMLPVDKLKIDRSFVRNVCKSRKDSAVVLATISLATALQIPVVAEGIEDQETIGILAGNNNLHLQGYLIGKPVSAEALTTWLSNRSRMGNGQNR